MMTNENPNSEVQCDQDCAPEKKCWSAPQLTVVSIAGLTENMSFAGNDGLGSSTLS